MVKKSIMLVAGGTGGHIFPAIAVAEVCQKNGEEVILLTDRRGEVFVKKNANLFSRIVVIPFLKMFVFFEKRQSNPIYHAIYVSILPISSLIAVLKFRPKIVWGFGGKITIFPLLWARILKIPCGIHQSDRVLGRANRFLSKVVNCVAVGYEKTHKVPANVKPFVTGTPVRGDFRKIPPLEIKEKDDLRICVLGGSQGAEVWGNIVPKSIGLLLPHEQSRFHIVHQCPNSQKEMVFSLYKKTKSSFVLEPFIHNLTEVLSKSHLVLSRAGASTIAELMASGRPAFLVPYPFAMDEHQWWNAQWIVQNGAGWMCREEDLTLNKLAKFLQEALHNPKKLIRMGQYMGALGISDSSYSLYELIRNLSENGVCTTFSPGVSEVRE